MFPQRLYDMCDGNPQRLRRMNRMFHAFRECCPRGVCEERVVDLVRDTEGVILHEVREKYATDAAGGTSVYNQNTGNVIECCTEKVMDLCFNHGWTAERLAHVTIRISNPSHFDMLRKRAEIKGSEGKESTIYQCGRCKGSRVFVESVQLRSADEGTNFRILCKKCGNKWIT